MLSLGALSFATPVALAALIVLPVIWWLLRVTPPTPLLVRFPPIRLLLGLRAKAETAHRTPPWLLILRLFLAGLVIVAAARPLLNAAESLPGSGPVVLIVDDGWGAGVHWDDTIVALTGLLDRAERDERQIIFATTAAREPTGTVGDTKLGSQPLVLPAASARPVVAALAPKPWLSDRKAVVSALLAMPALTSAPPAAIFWLSDGLRHDVNAEAGRDDLPALADQLRPFGAVTVLAPEPADTAVVLRPPKRETDPAAIVAERASGDSRKHTVTAVDDDGVVIARLTLDFGNGVERAEGSLDVPPDLARRIARLRIEPETSAGGVALLDERWRRRPVGIVAPGGTTPDLPLLGAAYYLSRALEPVAQVHQDSLDVLLNRELAVVIIADGDVPEGSSRIDLVDWIENGGVLLRFAGPRLAAAAATDVDDLLPVRLRPGDRTLGGALAWGERAGLAPFAENGPFAGLIATPDVEIQRQVLAEPSLDLDARTLVRLSDGTPLITGNRRGDGWIILVHTTADPSWSNLALSGLFVEVLERIVALSQGVSAGPGGPPLRPLEVMDGKGRLGPPSSSARPIDADAFAVTAIGPRHPPGLYGHGQDRRALNLSAQLAQPKLLGPLPAGIALGGYELAEETPLAPWLLAAALALALIDMVVSLWLRGLLRLRARRAVTGTAAIALLVLVTPMTSWSQTVVADGTAVAETLETRLAWIVTGDAAVDAVSDAGLAGLSALIERRTAVELGTPVAVNPADDELAFFPLLYWPLLPGADLPSPRAAEALKVYLANGGTILFDTRDQGMGGQRSGNLRALANVLDLPALVSVPPEHVLGRSYYLLDAFPGRWTGGLVWVEREGSALHDGVTAVVAGGHDWAGAWALDERRRPMFAVVPGGERQRELAYRFGINLVMHVLTGNYKADQVHLPAILERLEQ